MKGEVCWKKFLYSSACSSSEKKTMFVASSLLNSSVLHVSITEAVGDFSMFGVRIVNVMKMIGIRAARNIIVISFLSIYW